MVTARGRALGKYQLIAEIARGGMGIVYLAMVQGPGGFHKLVVVKELNPGVVEEPAFLTMFLDEARLAARLSHPNIVQTNEVGNDGDRYFLAMEYLDGRGLDHVRRRARSAGQSQPQAQGQGTAMSQAMYLRVLCDMLAGLDYAHRLTDFDGTPLGVVHRDVSPQNVFITFDGQVKLLDFGIAKAAGSLHETHAGVFKGKVSYMSPEQARGDKVDARADVFSAGVMMWEVLTGRRTREGQNDQEKLWALVAADLPRASTVKPSVPPELDDICARAMAWNRDERFASAAELQGELERYLASAGNVTARQVGACVAEMFREDRATTNGLIEAYVANARNDQSREALLPVIDVSSRSTSGGGTPSRISNGSVVHAPTDAPSTPPSELASAAPSSTHPVASIAAPPRSRTPWIIAGAASTLLVAGAVWAVWPGANRDGAKTAATATAGAGAAATAGAGAAATTGAGAAATTGAGAAATTGAGAAATTGAGAAATTGAGAAATAKVSVAAGAAPPTAPPAAGTPSSPPSAASPPSPPDGAVAATSPAATAAHATSPAATAAHATRYVSVEIRVSPPNAKLAIDDTEVPGNPFAGDLPADNVVHHVRASAPGYVTKSLPIELDANVSLDLILEHSAPAVRITSSPGRAPGRAPAARSTTAHAVEPARRSEPVVEPAPPPAAPPPPSVEVNPAARPANPADVDPNGGNRPRRTIDPANPYGGDE
jgi:serine/threonine protein kinase